MAKRRMAVKIDIRDVVEACYGLAETWSLTNTEAIGTGSLGEIRLWATEDEPERVYLRIGKLSAFAPPEFVPALIRAWRDHE